MTQKTNSPPANSPEVADLLARVDGLLQEGQPGRALDAVVRAKLKSPWAANALGVCHLRLGNLQIAVEVFRGLVLQGDLVLRTDLPTVFLTNYATALLLADNLSGCLRTLDEIRDSHHPAVQRLQGAVRRWREGLTFWQRLRWRFGGEPDRAVALDYPPGNLE
jgi:hypothetical protein